MQFCYFRLTMHGNVKISQNRTYRIAVMGAPSVGKSSIISRFLFGKFTNEHKETIEDLYRRDFQLADGTLTLEILDMAGTNEFPAMRDLAIATSDAFLLVHSLDDFSTFDEVVNLRQQILAGTKNSKAPIIIVGNKLDLSPESGTVQKKTAELTSTLDWGCSYVEASAKNNINILDLFMEMFNVCKLPCVLRCDAPMKKMDNKRCILLSH